MATKDRRNYLQGRVYRSPEGEFKLGLGYFSGVGGWRPGCCGGMTPIDVPSLQKTLQRWVEEAELCE
jgi:hypothetical protein